MAKKSRKCSSLTRRELLKTAAGAVVASPIVLAPSKKAIAKSLSDGNAVSWRKYSFRLALYIPKIYDNASSLGYRKYQRQKIVGSMAIGFDADGEIADVQFYDLVNRTHVLSNGKHVTYDGFLDQGPCQPRFNAIGSNKTNKFKTASICFAFAAEPSYNIGEFDEDTSLYLTLAGRGTMNDGGAIVRANGNASGTLGCGCAAYGHTSPTRKIGKWGATDEVTDVAAVYGTWAVKLIG